MAATRRRPSRSRSFVALSLVCLLATACGSTVQSRGQSVATDGTGTALSPDSQAPGRGPLSNASGGSSLGGSAQAPATASGAAIPGAPPAIRRPASSTPGVWDHSPIEIGILSIGGGDDKLAGAVGIRGAGSTYTGEQINDVLIAWFNAHGGIAGKPIKAIQHPIPIGGDWETETEAACAEFTQDHHVAVALSQTGNGYFSSYANCMAKVPNISAFIGGGTDAADFRQLPRMFSVNAPTIDRALTVTVEGMIRAKNLSASNMLGIIVEACPNNLRAYQASFQPLANRLNLDVTRHDVDCVQKYTDVGPLITQTQGAILKFHSVGVDRVMFVSGFTGVALVGFSQQADKQQYYPRYLLNSNAVLATGQSNYPPKQLVNMSGIGWAPDQDINAPTIASSATKRCRAILKAEGMVPRVALDRQFMDTNCDTFFALESALTATRGHDDPESLTRALESLGSSYTSAETLHGTTRFSPTQHDGPQLFTRFAYRPTCECFQYVAAPEPY